MIDVHLPATDGRTVILPRFTEPEADHSMLLHGLNLELPPQPKPRITAAGKLDDAPKGYVDFDKGVAKKFVMDPHAMLAA